MDAKQLRSIVKEEVTNIVQTQLEPLGKRLERVEDKVDALSGDIEQLHMNVKGIRDDIGLKHQRDKREIDEIKTHLRLPLMTDTPEI